MHEFRRAGVFGLVWVAVGVGCAYAVDGGERPSQAETITIPLDQIWALGMPGTRDVHEIVKVDTKHVPPRPSVLDRIVRSLLFRRDKQMPGYAVPGKPKRNLIWAKHAIYKRNDFGPIPTSEDVNLTFFAQVSSYHARLVSVRRDGFEIQIEYRFEPQQTSEAQVSFALIPLGKIPAGQYHVKVHRVPMEQKHLDAGFESVSDEQASRLVCGSFSFDVWEPPAPSKNAVMIPLDKIWALDMPGTMPMNAGLEEGKFFSEEGPLLRDIRYHFSMLLRRYMAHIAIKPEAGFVVSGTGMEALRKAHAILTKNEDRQTTFAKGQELSLVFFNYPSSWFNHLHEVTREENKINVRYKFVPNESTGATSITNHLALIPLNDLAEGEYQVQVTVKRLPLEQRYIEAGWPPQPPRPSRFVCQSFMFSIKKELKK